MSQAHPSLAFLPPLHYACVLFPGFQLLDVTGPLDILNLLSLQLPVAKDMTLTLLSNTLDGVPTKPLGIAKDRMNTAFSQSLLPTATFASYLSSLESGEQICDVLFIPGGMGTRLPTISSPYSLPAQHFVSAVAKLVKVAIITVCTGSDILAQTGLLNGRRATTNKSRFEFVSQRNTLVQWSKKARWVRSLKSEIEKSPSASDSTGTSIPIYSSAGISAGMDVTLAFIAEHYGGVEVARRLAKLLEYEWREVPEGGDDSFYDVYFPKDQ